MPLAVLNQNLVVLRAQLALGNPSTPVPNTLWLGLFVNNYLPTPTDALTAYVEPNDPGYAEVQLLYANWFGPAMVGTRLTRTYPLLSWTLKNGGYTVYGHFVLMKVPNLIPLWAQQWDQPFVVPAAGGALSLQLQWTDDQCP